MLKTLAHSTSTNRSSTSSRREIQRKNNQTIKREKLIQGSRTLAMAESLKFKELSSKILVNWMISLSRCNKRLFPLSMAIEVSHIIVRRRLWAPLKQWRLHSQPFSPKTFIKSRWECPNQLGMQLTLKILCLKDNTTPQKPILEHPWRVRTVETKSNPPVSSKDSPEVKIWNKPGPQI